MQSLYVQSYDTLTSHQCGIKPDFSNFYPYYPLTMTMQSGGGVVDSQINQDPKS